MPEHYDTPRRARNLTDEDIKALLDAFATSHSCKFPNVDHEKMDKIVRMSDFFEKIEDKVVGGITWAFLAIIGGILFLFYNHGYFMKGK